MDKGVMMDFEQARKHKRNALILIVVLVIIALVGNHLTDIEKTESISDTLLGCLVMLVVAWGMHKYSRAAGMVLFLAISCITLRDIYQRGLSFYDIIWCVVLYFIFQGTRAAFAVQKLRKEADSDYKSIRWWMWLLGIPAALLVLLVIGFEIVSSIKGIPSEGLHAGEELGQKTIVGLQEAGILRSDEIVSYLHQGNSYSLLYMGSIITDQRLVHYFKADNDKGIEVLSADIDDIIEVRHVRDGGWGETEAVHIYSKMGLSFYLQLPPDEEGGEKRFIEALRERIPKPTEQEDN